MQRLEQQGATLVGKSALPGTLVAFCKEEISYIEKYSKHTFKTYTIYFVNCHNSLHLTITRELCALAHI